MTINLANTSSSILFFTLLIVPFPSALALYFNLSPITPSQANLLINTTGDASISDQGIHVTPNERAMALDQKAGRATYVEPLHLWDKASGDLIDFTTHFSFVIDSEGRTPFADGLAFFLAPVGSSVSVDKAAIGLGLHQFWAEANSTKDSFIAVEFDTFPNTPMDPPTIHVGIDINSLKSATNVTWQNDITQGRENNASISYNATSRNLKVTFTGFEDYRTQEGSLNYTVDLRDYLPEWVVFGFSAATGPWFEKNDVKSWVFNSSNLQIGVPT